MNDLPKNFTPDRSEFIGHKHWILGPARKLVRTWYLVRESLYDLNRFREESSAVKRGNTKDKLIALITMAYHSLEKGLSLENPRTAFGLRHVQTLINRVTNYLDYYGSDQHCQTAINVLKSYHSFNKSKGVEMPGLAKQIETLEKRANYFGSPKCSAGTKTMTKEQFEKDAMKDLAGFFDARSSVRQYAPQPVSAADIEKAVIMAQKTPCVCNRQSGKVIAFQNPADVQKALEIQGGATGFKEGVPTVLAITSDISAFQSAGERYQGWIDGGLFAMSLIYALHSLGLVTCCLNWSKGKQTDLEFKKQFSIPQSESIIMLLSVGHPREKFEVAYSWRRPTNEVLNFYNTNS